MIDIIWITIKKHYILTICMFIMIIMTIIFNLLPPVILVNTAYLIENDPTIINSIIINDVNSLERLFSSGIISIIADSFKLISIIIVIFTKSYMLALLLLLVSPMVFYITI